MADVVLEVLVAWLGFWDDFVGVIWVLGEDDFGIDSIFVIDDVFEKDEVGRKMSSVFDKAKTSCRN